MSEDTNHRGDKSNHTDYEKLVFDWSQPVKVPERRRPSEDGAVEHRKRPGSRPAEKNRSQTSGEMNRKSAGVMPVIGTSSSSRGAAVYSTEDRDQAKQDADHGASSAEEDLLSLQPQKSRSGTGSAARPDRNQPKKKRSRSQASAQHDRNQPKTSHVGARSSAQQVRNQPQPKESPAGTPVAVRKDRSQPQKNNAGSQAAVREDRNRRPAQTDRSRRAKKREVPKTRIVKYGRDSARMRGGKSHGKMFVIPILLAVVLVVLLVTAGRSGKLPWLGAARSQAADYDQLPDYVEEQYLTVNSWSRPGIQTEEINGIVLHYTADPGKDAQDIRDYMEGLAKSHEARASANFVVGLDGRVIACVPLGEVAYASNSRNLDTVSIEYCYSDQSGKPTDETYQAILNLCTWLCGKYGLSGSDVIRHYDVTGTSCPQYYVDNPEQWTQFRADLADRLKSQPQEK